MNTTVEVRGPGLVVNRIASIIEKALRETNCTVEVDNEHPPVPDPTSIGKPTDKEDRVTVKVVHMPWGG